jgi:putative addiction module component (TIGR02574 family)
MGVDVPTLLNEIDALPLDDRAELLEEAWDRLLHAGYSPALSTEDETEIDRRVALLDAEPQNVLTWDEVETRVRKGQ